MTIDRRGALKWMGATLALASTLPGCVRKPPREVISREDAPEYRRPGAVLHYASTWTDGTYPYGMVVKTVEGRPIKIEGNEEHPVNGASSSSAMQASILSLYDPDRLRAPEGASSWTEVDERIRSALAQAKSIVLLTRSLLGPSERHALAAFLVRYPRTKHLVYEPLSDRTRRDTWRELYGRDGQWLPRFDAARIIVSLGSDFLATDGVELEAIRDFAAARDSERGRRSGPFPRLYVAEAELSLTGTNADHRLPLRPSAAAELVQAIRRGSAGGDLQAFAAKHGLSAQVLSALVADLRSHRGASVVLAGPQHAPAVHAAVALLNDALDAPGHTLLFNAEPPTLPVSAPGKISKLLQGGVDVLICLGTNPVYDWPGGGFEQLLGKAKLTVGHGLYQNETLRRCDIALPSHHNLESWNDASPRAGLTSLCQPAISPLYSTRQEIESLRAWTLPDTGKNTAGPLRELIRARLQKGGLAGASNARLGWQQALRRGLIEELVEAELPTLDRARAEQLAATPVPAKGQYELVLIPHHSAHDGRFGRHPWLLEVPDPVTKQMWGNAALLGPPMATTLGVKDGDVVVIRADGAAVELPALQVPGMPAGVVAVAVGWGQQVAGRATPAGANAYPLMPEQGRVRTDVTIEPLGRRQRVVLSQPTFSTHGRPLVLDTSAAELRADPNAVQRQRQLPAAQHRLYHPWRYSEGHKWAMVIDLNRCIGCHAWLWYNGVYTYLKRVTAFAVVPGAVIGSVPPAIGWCAAGGSLTDPGIWLVSGFFFVWQVPHFWLLALRHEADYRCSGWPVLTDTFSPAQLRRIAFAWIVAAGVSAMLAAGRLNPRLVWLALLAAASLWLVASSTRLLRAEGSPDVGPVFGRINAFAVCFCALLAVGVMAK